MWDVRPQIAQADLDLALMCYRYRTRTRSCYLLNFPTYYEYIRRSIVGFIGIFVGFVPEYLRRLTICYRDCWTGFVIVSTSHLLGMLQDATMKA